MKSINKLTTLILVVLAVIVPISSQNGDSPNISVPSMSFSAKLTKAEYLPLEPIPVILSYSNESDKTVTASSPNFFSTMVETTNSKGETVKFPMSFISVTSIAFPGKFEPGGSISETALVTTNLEKLFPTEGTYSVTFILPDGGQHDGELRSAPLEVVIEPAQGPDVEALRELRKQQKAGESPDKLFSWKIPKNGRGEPNALEAFVNQFQNSRYGDYAALHLANYYLAYGNPNAAKAIFERMENSSNEFFRSQSKNGLKEVIKKENQKIENP